LLRQSVILFGTGAQFSIAVLDRLLVHGLKPAALVLPGFAPAVLKDLGETQVDTGGEVNQFVSEAKRLSIPLIYLPESSQVSQAEKIAVVKADFILLACWPYLLSPEIINTAGKAALNLHPSILPNYRGADPVTAQIGRQEKKLGVSLHLLSQEYDQGDIVGQASLELAAKSPGRNLIEVEAARVGTSLFMKALQDFGGPAWKPRPQGV
jgi:methionyl-tRNA formyltransferase